MNVEDARQMWNDAEEIQSIIISLRERVEKFDIEPELKSKLFQAYFNVAQVISSIRYYDVTEDRAALNRRDGWDQSAEED